MIEYWLPGEAEVTIGPPGECIPKIKAGRYTSRQTTRRQGVKPARRHRCLQKVALIVIPAEDDGLTGSFSSVMYPGGGVSVIGKVALSGRPSGTADANSSRLGSSGCSIGICNEEYKTFCN